MARSRNKAGFKQRYSTNTIQASSAGRTNAQTAQGTLRGNRQTLTTTQGRVGRGGRLVSKNQVRYDLRAGMNNDQRSPEAIARLRAKGIQVVQGQALSLG